ncbi:Diacylglycerol kinase family enzyme [Eubacterium ruminantium]|nr:Diacylglycerol kinase family enzyme [Eubacterium ruminantium]
MSDNSRNIYFIVNINGGGGRAKKTWMKVREILDIKGISAKMFKSRYPGDSKKFVEKLTEKTKGIINIIIIGGDGTVNEVINGITDFSRTRIGIIPTGSGNDFARGLGIPKRTGKALAKVLNGLTDSRIRLVDVGLTTVYGDENVALQLGKASGVTSLERRFGISSGIGLDALVCKKVDNSKMKGILNSCGLGGMSYIIMTIISLFTMEKNDVRIKMSNIFKKDESKYNSFESNLSVGKASECKDIKDYVSVDIRKLIFFAAMNMRCEGGGVPMAPKAKYDDGELSCTLAYDVPKWKSFFILPVLVMAKHDKSKNFMLFNKDKIELVSDKEMVVHVDGEYGGESKHVKFEMLPEKLQVIL